MATTVTPDDTIVPDQSPISFTTLIDRPTSRRRRALAGRVLTCRFSLDLSPRQPADLHVRGRAAQPDSHYLVRILSLSSAADRADLR